MRTLLALLTVIVWSMTAAASPAAASGAAVINDCVNGTLKSSYSLDDYREALGNLPADLAEYTDCEAQITAARDRQLTGSAKPATYAAGAKTTATAPGAQVGTTYGDPAAATPADAPASTTPVTPTTPQTEPSNEATSGDDELLAVPVAGPGDGGPSAGASGDGDGVPVVPVVIALSVIALTIARAMVMWSRKPETFAEADPA